MKNQAQPVDFQTAVVQDSVERKRSRRAAGWKSSFLFVLLSLIVIEPNLSYAVSAADGKMSASVSTVPSKGGSKKSDKPKGAANAKSGDKINAKKSETLFEGYYKILQSGLQIGFLIVRYSFDSKTGHFRSGYYLKTDSKGNDISESWIAEADQNFAPVSLIYNSIMPKNKVSIEAQFKDGVMKGSKTVNGKAVKITKNLPKGTFLSAFLTYVMMKQPEGLAINNKYDYKAIAEEELEIYPGVAIVEKETNYKGYKTFKVSNRFKDVGFIAYLTDRGDLVGTESPTIGLSTELVAKASDATNGFNPNAKLISAIFGDVPTGTVNAAYEMLQGSSEPKTDSSKVDPALDLPKDAKVLPKEGGN